MPSQTRHTVSMLAMPRTRAWAFAWSQAPGPLRWHGSYMSSEGLHTSSRASLSSVSPACGCIV